MNVKLIIATAIVLSSAFSATAQNGQRTLRDENVRIRRGAENGQLTRHETVRLKREERRLRKEARRFRANDGRIGPAERRKLRRDEKRLDRRIRHERHDRHRRH